MNVFTTKCSLSKSISSPTFEILGVLFVNEVGQVSSVVEDHVEGLSIGKDDRLKMPSFYYSFKEKNALTSLHKPAQCTTCTPRRSRPSKHTLERLALQSQPLRDPDI